MTGRSRGEVENKGGRQRVREMGEKEVPEM